jgi:hypothetical protein
MMPIIMQFSPPSCHTLSVFSPNILNILFSKTPSVYVKGKVTPVQAMEALRVARG